MSESLSTDQRVALLESRVNHLEDALSQFLSGKSGALPEKLIASSPVMPDVFGAWAVIGSMQRALRCYTTTTQPITLARI